MANTKTKKTIAGIGAGVIMLGGGTVAADKIINPYTDKGTILEIATVSSLPEGGNQKIDVDTTEPKISLSKWNGETNLGVRYTGIQSKGSRPFLSKNVEWNDDVQKMEAVPIAPQPGIEDGGMEINIILNSEPVSNVFTFQMDNWENLDFFYQPALTAQEIQEGSSRPDNVVGSYAVYYKNHANHIEGQTNYATGKAYHIFRPKVTDAKGNTIWADMSYANGVLTITVPQSFLDSAVYPVKVDPEFGYHTIGGTSLGNNIFNTRMVIASTTSASDISTITSLSFYLEDTVATVNVKLLLTDSTAHILTNGIAPAVSGVATANWYTATYVSAPSISPSTNYNWGAIADGTNTQGVIWYYDSVVGFGAGRDTTNSYTTPTDPTDMQALFDVNGFKMSAYATYTASASATAVPASFATNGSVQVNGSLKL